MHLIKNVQVKHTHTYTVQIIQYIRSRDISISLHKANVLFLL